MTDLAPVLQGFFTDRLARQKKASPDTITSYRDTCRLLLAFAQDKTGRPPSALSLADLDAALVGAFLQHLEEDRGNGSATRNARLAAIHSLFRYAAPRAPEHAAVISQVLSTLTVCAVSGVALSLRPFPWQRTCGPAPRWMSWLARPVSSDTRRPAWTSSRSSAWSRRPCHVVRSGAAVSASASSGVR